MHQKKCVKTIILLCLLTLLISCNPEYQTHSPETTTAFEQPKTVEAFVDRVVDGDTIQVVIEGDEEIVRFLLVDTPETKHPNLPKQPFGEEASKFAKKVLTNQTVTLEFDGPKRDKYDRLLAYVWFENNMFNELLLEQGLARYAYQYDPPYTYQQQLKQAESQAMGKNIGIWSLPGYVTEEGFEQQETVDSDQVQDTTDQIYQTCSDAHTANVTPIYQGDRGYSSHLDRDGDGIACE